MCEFDCEFDEAETVPYKIRATIPAATMKIIGSRLKEARDVAGLSQSDAAFSLLIETDILDKLEKALDIEDEFSINLIIQAGNLYDVSLDYIFGITDDWERGIIIERKTDFISMFVEATNKHRIKWINEILRQKNRIDTVCNALAEYHDGMIEHRQAIDKFIALNPKFDNMKGGASVVGSLQRIEDKIYNCRASIKRFRADFEAEKIGLLTIK